MKKYIFPVGIVLLVILVCIGILISVNSEESDQSIDTYSQKMNGEIDVIVPDAMVITLTDDGYEPNEVSVRVGDTITFKSTRNALFWPASDLHPSHLLYSEFDPLTPLQPNQTWSFTFTKVGIWEFHDHLFPYYTGVITVIE